MCKLQDLASSNIFLKAFFYFLKYVLHLVTDEVRQ